MKAFERELRRMSLQGDQGKKQERVQHTRPCQASLILQSESQACVLLNVLEKMSSIFGIQACCR